MQAYNLSAAEVRHIETQQLTELWGKYGNNGNLSELWFDGGINGPMQPVNRLCSSHCAALTVLLLCTPLSVTLSLLTLAVSLHVPLIGDQNIDSGFAAACDGIQFLYAPHCTLPPQRLCLGLTSPPCICCSIVRLPCSAATDLNSTNSSTAMLCSQLAWCRRRHWILPGPRQRL